MSGSLSWIEAFAVLLQADGKLPVCARIPHRVQPEAKQAALLHCYHG